MHYYTREVKDYSAQTMHLSLLEHGVYVRLIDIYLVNESPIQDATKYRICGAKAPAEKAAVNNILSEFFFLSDGFWRHPWCDKAIAKYRNRSAANKSNGEKGGRPKVVNFQKAGEHK